MLFTGRRRKQPLASYIYKVSWGIHKLLGISRAEHLPPGGIRIRQINDYSWCVQGVDWQHKQTLAPALGHGNLGICEIGWNICLPTFGGSDLDR